VRLSGEYNDLLRRAFFHSAPETLFSLRGQTLLTNPTAPQLHGERLSRRQDAFNEVTIREHDVTGGVMRAGMMASRLYHRERVIPALTDHMEDEAG
jgi:hypothetical protein